MHKGSKVNSAKDHYGFDIKIISNLNDIEKDNSFHYVFQVDSQRIHFLYRPAKNSHGLLVAFHGARLNSDGSFVPLPLFRAFDYPEKIKNISILSFSDPLLDAYDAKALKLAWYLDSSKYKTSHHIDAITDRIMKLEATDSVLFFGSSGGGFPAIRHAGIFGMKTLISNSQLILKEYGYYAEFESILSKNHDNIIEAPDIREKITKCSYPSRVILYINELDKQHLTQHVEPFRCYLKECSLENILDYRPFRQNAPEGKTPHHVQWDRNLEDIIKEIFRI